MIKKNITVFILGIILSLMLTGCGVEEGTSVKKELIVDKSVPIESFDIEDYSKVLEAPSETYFEKIYNNIDDLYNEADNVVYGTVKSVEYFDETGVALTYFNFIIEKVYKGELNENDMISIMTNGGFCRLKNYIKVFGNGKFSDYSQKEIDDTIIKFTGAGQPLTKVGDKYVLFLSPPIKDEKPFPTGAYVQIGSFMGRYYYQNNKLMRFKPANEPDLYKNSNDVFSFNTIDEELGKRKMAFQKRGE